MSVPNPIDSDPVDFSADKSILGFKYQIRYALFLLFEAQRTQCGFDVSIDIERIDDIDVHSQGEITKLVQTKNSATVLTNSSSPFWKTVRIWAEAVRSGLIDLEKIQRLELVTTSAGPSDDGAIVSCLQLPRSSCREHALNQMRQIASAKRGHRTLGSAYSAFANLTVQEQEQLVSKIYVLTDAPSFDELDDQIRQCIVQGPPGKHVAFSDVLFGKWDTLVECYLREGKKSPITWQQLQSLLWEISQQFEDDNLPTEFVGMLQNAFPSIADDTRVFIRQMIAVGASDRQLQRAQRLYLKSTQLIAFWQRHVIVRPDEVAAHADRLVDECELKHESVGADVKFASVDAKQVGMHIYNWASAEASHMESFRIRPRCSDPDVVRGCFHDLADRAKLGWHPDWGAMFGR